jgi:guanine nucleotide-binding protein subunit alpha
LNKIDLLAEKQPHSPLEDYFSDYQGGSNYDAACNYLLHRFVSLNQSAATKQIYAHYACAIDMQQIKSMCSLIIIHVMELTFVGFYMVVLSVIQDILLQLRLRECGLL